MADLAHFWGNDLTVSATGDILMADGDDLTTQRIIRRLMTAEGDYIWSLNYGGGLPGRIGTVLNLDLIKSVIRSQIALEATVARSPAPTINVTEILNGVSVYILFYSAKTGQQATLSFDINQ
ncbi:phage tail protein [Neorhizobium sp. P12A]|uniref:phage tail protein n=1 Tax=Neorhizobium sp. P12A TaxID=2268027 RepID=UPI0011EE3E47|nr:phage tail protein [Neorhizobium sp. P12A]KAA0685994.1 phage tail protein [Neorhizobium sp. P12A]